MVEIKNPVEVTGANGVVWEQFIVTGGGVRDIELGDIDVVENALNELEYETHELEWFTDPSDKSVTVFIVHYTDMYNVVVGEEKRKELMEEIGTDEWPKLSQHFIVSEGFIKNNWTRFWDRAKESDPRTERA